MDETMAGHTCVPGESVATRESAIAAVLEAMEWDLSDALWALAEVRLGLDPNRWTPGQPSVPDQVVRHLLERPDTWTEGITEDVCEVVEEALRWDLVCRLRNAMYEASTGYAPLAEIHPALAELVERFYSEWDRRLFPL